jgi:hypothetical protein
MTGVWAVEDHLTEVSQRGDRETPRKVSDHKMFDLDLALHFGAALLMLIAAAVGAVIVDRGS